MKPLKNYQELWNLTDKEYIYLLECYYWGYDKIKAIENNKGISFLAIPDTIPYALWFSNGKRISQEEGLQSISITKESPKSY